MIQIETKTFNKVTEYQKQLLPNCKNTLILTIIRDKTNNKKK